MSIATVTATVEPNTVPPRVRLDVADTGAPSFASVTVTRLNPDGTTVPVRTSDGNPLPMSANAGLIYDSEPPYGQPVSYSTRETPANVTAQVTVPASKVWLIHPGVPTLSMPIELYADSFAEEEWGVAQGIFWPMGRETPVVQTGGRRRAPSSSVTVAIDTLADLDSLRALVSDASVLLLNVPPALGLGVDTCYVAIGSIRSKRVTNIGSDPNRSVEMPITVVDRPAGGSQSQRTYADLLVYPTYAALQSAYVDYAAVLAGP